MQLDPMNFIMVAGFGNEQLPPDTTVAIPFSDAAAPPNASSWLGGVKARLESVIGVLMTQLAATGATNDPRQGDAELAFGRHGLGLVLRRADEHSGTGRAGGSRSPGGSLRAISSCRSRRAGGPGSSR
jgi:hypothetical protein